MVASRALGSFRITICTLLLVAILFCRSSPGFAGSWSISTQRNGSSTATDVFSYPDEQGTWIDGSSLETTGNCLANQQASATSSGTIKITYTWTPDTGKTIAEDPPPNKLLVNESARAIWSYNDSPARPPYMRGTVVSTSASIGDIPGTNPFPPPPPNASIISGGLSGSRTTLHDVPASGVVELQCAVSASATYNASGSLGGRVLVSVSYIITGTRDIRLLRDGEPITNENNMCLPGEAVNLSVSGADPGSTYTWQIGGDYFKDFTPSTPSVFEGAGAVIRDQETCTYRYIKGDDAEGTLKTVGCTVFVNGSPVDVIDNLKVYQPESGLKATQGVAWFNSSPLLYVNLSPTPDSGSGYGMDWRYTTVLPSAAGGGIYGFFQTGSVSRNGFKGSNQYRLPLSFSNGLDSGAPYFNVTFPTNTILGEFGDNPDERFQQNVVDPFSGLISITMDELSISDSFETWLMFQSGLAGSSWVPLRKLQWSWGASVLVTHPYGQINNVGSGNITGIPTTQFPSWSTEINAKAEWEWANP